MRRILPCSVLLLLAVAMSMAVRGSAGDEKKDAKAAKKGMRIEGELKADDPADKLTKAPGHVHKVKLLAGKVYKIEMHAADGTKLDPFLRLEDPKGAKLAMDDDSAGELNARLLFEAPTDGEYRVIATALPTSKESVVGKYTLTVEPINWKRYLAAELKPLADKGPDVTLRDAQKAMMLGMGLEGGSKTLAADAYSRAGEILTKSSNAQVQQFGKLLEGAARRMKLMGQPIEVHGQTLAGKEFDWKAYKGKVVLIDFWATWCGPCRAEIPNIKAMYAKYHKRGFDVVGVSIDKGKDAPTKYMEKEELPWTCLHDPSAAKGQEQLTEYYGIFAIPQAILVDREGRVVSLHARGEELQELLGNLIDKGAKGKQESK